MMHVTGKIILAGLAMVLITGCQKVERHYHQEAPKAKLPPATIPAGQVQGGYSGGGGFKFQDANYILDRVQKELLQQLEFAGPDVFELAPRDKFTPASAQALYVKLIRNLKRDHNQVVKRYGQELAFNYGTDESGEPYLIAVNGYFDKMSSVVASVMNEAELAPYILETKLRLIHEANHLLGVGLTQETDKSARNMAQFMMLQLFTDNIGCSQGMKKIPTTWPYTQNHLSYEQTLLKAGDDPFVFLFSRGRGAGVIFSPVAEAAYLYSPQIDIDNQKDTDAYVEFKSETFRQLGILQDNQGGVQASDFLPSLAVRTKAQREYPRITDIGHTGTYDLTTSKVFDWVPHSYTAEGVLTYVSKSEKMSEIRNDDAKIPGTEKVLKGKVYYQAVLENQLIIQPFAGVEAQAKIKFKMTWTPAYKEPEILAQMGVPYGTFRADIPPVVYEGEFPLKCWATSNPEPSHIPSAQVLERMMLEEGDDGFFAPYTLGMRNFLSLVSKY